ncbi:hypothetical protein D3C80_684730 [compost metagenome]
MALQIASGQVGGLGLEAGEDVAGHEAFSVCSARGDPPVDDGFQRAGAFNQVSEEGLLGHRDRRVGGDGRQGRSLGHSRIAEHQNGGENDSAGHGGIPFHWRSGEKTNWKSKLTRPLIELF